MKLSTEQIETIKSYASVEELIKDVPDVDSKILKALYNQYNSNDLSEEELENVNGGTCFSSGVKNPNTGETKKYAIVSPLNLCPLNGMAIWRENTVCGSCSSAFTVSGTWYCDRRWKGHNTPKLFDPGSNQEGLGFIDD